MKLGKDFFVDKEKIRTIDTFRIVYFISFLFAFTQVKQHNYQIKQLENCLVEIEENTINEVSIKKYKANRIKNTGTIGITLIIGVILFLFLVFGIIN